MPPKFGGGEKCDRCGKTVYAAEKFAAGKCVFHKLCFKCKVCKLSLKLETYQQADGELYCKKHFNECVVAQNLQEPAAAL